MSPEEKLPGEGESQANFLRKIVFKTLIPFIRYSIMLEAYFIHYDNNIFYLK